MRDFIVDGHEIAAENAEQALAEARRLYDYEPTSVRPRPKRYVDIAITETVTYAERYELETIERFCYEQLGMSDDDLQEVHDQTPSELSYARELVEMLRDGGAEPFCTDVERHGDIQGQIWDIRYREEQGNA